MAQKKEIDALKKEIAELKAENNLLKEKQSESPGHHLAISSHDIDTLLEEIHEEKEPNKGQKAKHKVYWVGLRNQMAVQQTSKIKEMILSGALNVEEHGEELLRAAARNGCADIIDTAKMHWKGITTEMYNQAISAAETAGNFHVANQLYFGKMGKEAKANSMQILEKIKRDKAVNDYLCKQNDEVFLNSNLEKVMDAIKRRLPFHQDMLSLAWHYCWFHKKNVHILNSKLWKLISSQMSDIISNMQRMQRDFLWLTTWLLKSVIFYVEVDGRPLFERANEIVNGKVHKEASARLNVIMSQLKKDDDPLWNKLQAYGMEDDYVMIEEKKEKEKEMKEVRQDNTQHPIKPEYDEHALRRLNAAIGSTGVNIIDLYNETVYLGQIHMKNSILNDEFQNSVKKLLSDLKKKDSNVDYVLSPGPIKKLDRCLTKIDTKYGDAKFPSSSQILDIARCTVIFNDMPSMLSALDAIEHNIRNGDGYSIKRILRKKNLFRDYSFNSPGYCDVKLNVEVFHKSVESISIVAEIQVMVQFMNTFKKEISHKLYRIQRQQEQFEKITQIAKKITAFEPNLTAILAAGTVTDLMKYMIEHIIDCQFLIGYRFENKSNIFHGMFRFDNIELYRYIIRNNVSKQLLREKFKEGDVKGNTPIFCVLRSNSVRLIDLLCDEFPDLIINYRNPRSDLLTIHYASYKGNRKLLDFVFEHAPKDPNKLDELIMSKENDGTTVFQWASNKGMLFAMKILWQNVSDPLVKKEMLFGGQNKGRTPFYYTVVGNHLEAAKWLLSLCENDEEKRKMIHHTLKSGQSIYGWMVQVNTWPDMIKQLQDWIKMYPQKT